jgi:hypothetical protein
MQQNFREPKIFLIANSKTSSNKKEKYFLNNQENLNMLPFKEASNRCQENG